MVPYIVPTDSAMWTDAWTAGPLKAVSEGHLSAGDPPPRVPRVPKPQVLIIHGCISQEKEPIVSRGLGVFQAWGRGVLGSSL
jgi:hypothetical protein